MRLSLRVTIVLLVLAGGMPGCSTPERRARANFVAFHRLSSKDQALALHGHVRRGMSREAVYVAWGAPDQKIVSNDGKGQAGDERWIYLQRISLTEPLNSYDYHGPSLGFGGMPARPFPEVNRGIAVTGNEAFLRFQPHVRTLDTLRIAEFSHGEVANTR